MEKQRIKKLHESFSELERAISSAKLALSNKKNVPKYINLRIETYEEMLSKQKSLFAELCQNIKDNNQEEVCRIVKLINGLSSMIRDDAREIISGTQQPFTFDEREELLL